MIKKKLILFHDFVRVFLPFSTQLLYKWLLYPLNTTDNSVCTTVALFYSNADDFYSQIFKNTYNLVRPV